MEWTSGFMDFRFLFQKGSNCHPLTNSIHVDKVKTSQKLKHTIFLQGKESHIFLLSLTLLSEKKKKKNLIQILLLQGRGSLKDANKLLDFFWSRDTRSKEYSCSSFTSSRYTSDTIISLLMLHVMLFTYLRVTSH